MKRHKQLATVCLSFVLPCLTYAQASVGGSVKDNNGNAIPFVNIGIKGKNIGTVSDQKGLYLLDIPSNQSNDSITFSCVGYQSKSYAASNLRQGSKLDVTLNEANHTISEVVVISSKPKIKKIGTTTYNPLLWGAVENKKRTDIVEFASLIKINKPSDIRSISIYLRGVNIDSATFRINFYQKDGDLPGERLNTDQIIARESLSKGWITLDLTKYALKFDTPIFAAIELLPENKSKGYSFSYGGQFGGYTAVREVSLGSWKKAKGASISLYLTVRQ